MVYGDFGSGMVVATRADASLRILTETVAADYDAVDCVFVARIGAAVLTPDAFRLGSL
jgi:HK97 family phage major capsid protein